MNNESERGWLTVKEAAAYLAVNEQYIYDACATGGLQHARLAGKRSIRLRREWLDEWMNRHAVAASSNRGVTVNYVSA